MSHDVLALVIPLASTLGGAIIAGFFSSLKVKSDNSVKTNHDAMDLVAKQTEQIADMAVKIGELTRKIEELERILRKNNIEY